MVSADAMPLSTIVKPARPSISSSSTHRLMWSSANGSGMRTQCRPGRSVIQAPVAGGSVHG